MAEPDEVPLEQFADIEALDRWFKRLKEQLKAGKAGTDAVRELDVQRLAVRAAFQDFRARQAIDPEVLVRFTSEEQLSIHYKKLIARSKPENEEAIRIAYAGARVAFLRRRALLAEYEHRQMEIDAKARVDDAAAAKLAYGYPAAGGPGIKPDRFAERTP